MSQKTKALLVMGMHRSGTSALAKGLEVFGADLGINLMPATDANPKGYYEDLDIWRLNSALLASLGQEWQSLDQPDPAHLANLCDGNLFKEAVTLVSQRLQRSRLLGLKDPRFSRLLPFWKSVFLATGAEPIYLIAIRDPQHVAASLQLAEKIEEQQSHYLWLSYTVEALKNVGDSPALLVEYTRLLANPRQEMERIARAFKLPIDQRRMDDFAGHFLDVHLNRMSNAEGTVPPFLRRIYGQLSTLSAAPPSAIPNNLPLHDWKCELTHVKLLLERTQSAENRLTVRAAEADRLRREKEELSATIESLSGRVDALVASTSWQVTSPIRRLGEAKRKIATMWSSKRQPLSQYERWVLSHDTPDKCGISQLRDSIVHSNTQTLISLVIQLRDSQPNLLTDTIGSLIAQIYPFWHLYVLDGSTGGFTPQDNHTFSKPSNTRITVLQTLRSGEQWSAVNSALETLEGDFVALLDPGDLLAPHALYCVNRALSEQPNANLIYSDEDSVNRKGDRHSPQFKTPLNKELLLCCNTIGRLTAYRRSTLREVGGLRDNFPGAEEWDAALRMVEASRPDQVVHIPRVLYHRRYQRISPTKLVAESGRQAVADYLGRTGVRAEVSAAPDSPAANRVRYLLPPQPPLVSIIIPTKDHAPTLRRCVESIRAKTTYQDYEILIVDNGSTEITTLDLFRDLRRLGVRVIPHSGGFNYSRLNNSAAKEAHGQILCLLNNDIEIISRDWLDEMVSIALQPKVGAVGARLWYPNGTLQHAGVVLGLGGVAGHVNRHLKKGQRGYMSRAVLRQELSAVTAACLVVTKAAFEEVGGLDESLAVSCNDVDFCMRLRQAGYRNIWTPYAEMIHHESLSRGTDDTPEKKLRADLERHFMKRRWGDTLVNDPAYSPNLTLDDESSGLAWPPRVPPLWRSLRAIDVSEFHVTK